jgi:hypothetical protein
MHAVLIACCVVLLLTAKARAEGARTWMFHFDSDAAVLQYGSPDSDDMVIAFSCEPARQSLHIAEFVGSNSLLPGRTAQLKLSAGSTSVGYSGQTVANEMDGTVNIEVTTPIDPKLFALLKSAPSFTLEVAGKRETIPLAGAPPHVAAFEKACLAKP